MQILLMENVANILTCICLEVLTSWRTNVLKSCCNHRLQLFEYHQTANGDCNKCIQTKAVAAKPGDFGSSSKTQVTAISPVCNAGSVTLTLCNQKKYYLFAGHHKHHISLSRERGVCVVMPLQLPRRPVHVRRRLRRRHGSRRVPAARQPWSFSQPETACVSSKFLFYLGLST